MMPRNQTMFSYFILTPSHYYRYYVRANQKHPLLLLACESQLKKKNNRIWFTLLLPPHVCPYQPLLSSNKHHCHQLNRVDLVATLTIREK